MKFKSDESIAYGGFSSKYEAGKVFHRSMARAEPMLFYIDEPMYLKETGLVFSVCGGVFSSSEGLLRSPYYPNNYPRHRDCVYVISLPVGKGINLQFLDFDIEPGSDTNCFFDFLEVILNS